MKRRNFLKAAALGTLAGAVKLNSSNLLANDSTIGSAEAAANDMVAVMGGEPLELYKKGIEAMGGIGRFVKKGQKVVVKPNIGWDKAPELAANTNPELVEAIVKDCLAAGAAEVTVFDNTCDEWQACYKNSGIEEAAKRAGAKVAFAHDEKYFVEVNLPKGIKLKKAKIHQAIIDCDVWINVPILKTHGGAKLTMAMKNYMGIVWDRRIFHQNDLQQCIADICTWTKKPVLNIVDAYRIMHQNGPQGKSAADVALVKSLIASTDIVAVDTAALNFFNQVKKLDLDAVGHIGKGQDLKLGTTNLDKLEIKRIKL